MTFAAQAVPRRIGKYIISHVLGAGAMGIVYKAVDPSLHRSVAIKTIRRPLLEADAQDLAAAQRFHHEAQAAGRLNHPNIVAIHEYGESGDEMFIAMEYVEGRSLFELTARGERLALPDVIALMLQLLDALACAHAQNVWHRDIKPANLLVTPEGRLKVSDFGIARIDSVALTQVSTALGSPGYMAPERYTGETTDQRVDLFSCGVLLYELLSGESPFKGSNSAVMYQVLQQDPPAPSSLAIGNPPPAAFDAVVAKALAKNAGDRFASAVEMRDALLSAAPEGTLKQTPPATGPQAAPTRRVVRTADLPVLGDTPMRPDVVEKAQRCLAVQIGPIAALLAKRAAASAASREQFFCKLADLAGYGLDRKMLLAKLWRIE